MHCLDCKALTISRARVERCHRTAGPTEDRFKLRDSRAAVRCPGRCNLANAVRRSGHTSRAARRTEQVAECFLGQRSPALPGDEGEISTRTSGKRLGEHRQDRQRNLRYLSRHVAYPPPSFAEPCLPTRADRPPVGSDWVHEIKHDGFRLLACRDPTRGVRLLTRNANDFTARYRRIVKAVSALRVKSCLIDGEAVACDNDGLPVFERLRPLTTDLA